jgi:hypothetical protein
VYGSSQQVADTLREFQGGRLRVELKYGRQFPPSNNNKSALCDHVSESEACYLAGAMDSFTAASSFHCFCKPLHLEMFKTSNIRVLL